MGYKIEKAYCWYNKESQIVLMYFINHIPFTFDELSDFVMEDPEIIKKADEQRRWNPEDLYRTSFYLIDEEAQIICDFFYERYEVKMTIKKMKGRFSIRCGTQNARKLISILEPYCMSGMEYKFKPILEN